MKKKSAKIKNLPKSKNLSKIKNVPKNQNNCQKKNQKKMSKIKLLPKNQNFCQKPDIFSKKSKLLPKFKFFAKKQNFCQKSKNSPKIKTFPKKIKNIAKNQTFFQKIKNSAKKTFSQNSPKNKNWWKTRSPGGPSFPSKIRSPRARLPNQESNPSSKHRYFHQLKKFEKKLTRSCCNTLNFQKNFFQKKHPKFS